MSSLGFVICAAIVVVYLRYISPNVSHLIAFGVLLGIVSSVCVYFFLDESAIFLIKTGQHEKAEAVLGKIFIRN